MGVKISSNQSFLNKVLYSIEKVGNALPHPATLFAILTLIVFIASFIISACDVSVIHPSTGEQIKVVNLLSAEGLRIVLTKTVSNFTSFAPLGTVLVALLGIGVAEYSGLISVLLRVLVLKAPKRLLTFSIVFIGVLSNTASEVGYVLVVPLSAMAFLAVGKNPLAGFAAAFAGVSGGYSANLLLGTIDPLLAGISEEAAHIIKPGYVVGVACNYYFMFVSTFLIAALGTFVTEKIIEPRLGKYQGDAKPESLEKLSKKEKKGLLYTALTIIALSGLVLLGIIPKDGILRSENGGLLNSPFLKGIVVFIFIFFLVGGAVYGAVTGKFKKDADIVVGMNKSMQSLGSYIVLVFFASQFVAYFNFTNIGLISAIEGAEFLKSMNFTGLPLLIGFIVVAAFINLFMGSASAKWAILAPVFIPMFMLMGYSPELTQLAYRIGDSTTNIVTPMMSYFPIIIAYLQKYYKDAGIGTLISLMIPYTVTFLVGWIIMFLLWVTFNIPLGPGAGSFFIN